MRREGEKREVNKESAEGEIDDDGEERDRLEESHRLHCYHHLLVVLLASCIVLRPLLTTSTFTSSVQHRGREGKGGKAKTKKGAGE